MERRFGWRLGENSGTRTSESEVMNKITFPLKPQTKGPEVADLQDALRQLLERSAVLRDNEGTRQELAKALQKERETQSFGDATRKLVSIFQKERQLADSNGAIDSPTAD